MRLCWVRGAPAFPTFGQRQVPPSQLLNSWLLKDRGPCRLRRTDLDLWHKPNSVPAFARRRSFISLGFPSAQLHLPFLRKTWSDLLPSLKAGPGATITRGALPAFAGKAGRLPFPLLCLAPHGVFRAAPLTRTPGGLLLRLFTLTQLAPGGVFSVTLSVVRDFHPGRPRFHGACCLPVFGLSSGQTGAQPAITRHNRKISTERVPVPAVTLDRNDFPFLLVDLARAPYIQRFWF
jgi:hypothetical protein